MPKRKRVARVIESILLPRIASISKIRNKEVTTTTLMVRIKRGGKTTNADDAIQIAAAVLQTLPKEVTTERKARRERNINQSHHIEIDKYR